jgi:hypothetical protein
VPSISVTFDCGELGFAPIAAHGHADALSFTLRAFGEDVLIDPGTYDYFTYRRWRDYFRSTRAHNTVAVDGRDQSEPLGLFLWGRRARASCLRWEQGPEGGTVEGEHDGYRVLERPVRHRRSITLDAGIREVRVCDRLTGAGEHTADFALHLAEGCVLEPLDGNRFEIICAAGRLRLDLDERLSVRTLRGSDDPIGGWVSRGYHHKQATTTIVGSCTWQDGLESVIRISII